MGRGNLGGHNNKFGLPWGPLGSRVQTALGYLAWIALASAPAGAAVAPTVVPSPTTGKVASARPSDSKAATALSKPAAGKITPASPPSSPLKTTKPPTLPLRAAATLELPGPSFPEHPVEPPPEAPGPAPAPKIYQNPETGQVFVPQQKVWIRISLDAKAPGPGVLLQQPAQQSNDSAQVTLVLDLAQKLKDSRGVKGDFTPPKASYSITNQGPPDAVETGPWVVSLEAKDPESGVDQIYYSLNRAPFEAYQGPVTFKPESHHSFRVAVTDRVGNPSEPHEILGSLDQQVAEKHLEVENAKGNLRATQAPLKIVKVSETPASRELFAKFASNPKMTLRPFQGTALDLALADRAERARLNPLGKSAVLAEKVGGGFDDYLDKEPPYVIGNIVGEKFLKGQQLFVSGRSQVILDAKDDQLGVKEVWFRQDNGKTTPYQGPLPVPQKPGEYKYYFQATDKADNKSIEKNLTLNVDLFPPKSLWRFETAPFKRDQRLFVSQRNRLILEAQDPDSGVREIQFSKAGQTDRYQRPLDTDQDKGEVVIEYHGVDQVGNLEAPQKLEFYVDPQPPQLFYYFSNQKEEDQGAAVYPLGTLLFLASSDQESGLAELAYSLNGAVVKPFTGPVAFSQVGDYQILLIGKDEVGNEAKETILFRIRP
ncbi:MAG: hypothetical protein A2600_06690 [Candidatus Lambdaproteobacteria bacterium RIFOXYD1_FULL_56_27]|uniref:Ig-like domain-containing protein n=1 Tax=Candidatus Lambdaproteobacteria bacterium RIFOXYD2_FULL_56_26 TaxID=1817773 RepID=A0A1F6GL08_9PROT|nr:MAG: hypothetical protein A2557_13470 [Candidatus Lambdaproteobacteria bacterium RIFOXYD2_FULL_56_26]OGH04216.1 MAG: hypothetical protein A2426_02380 [Candidatus Lambdaproteobacteria bacterium RIFOXYC1_FULL_56_13]OGH08858.1 MAG: hypothetical protein A2600_06690 [Candidatus Lambdaproteobacteria bacterium RIFOXYD1_FULL_56_27]